MLCPPGMGGNVAAADGDLWRMAPALARQTRRCRLAAFGGTPARRCLSEPADSQLLNQFVKEEHAACRAADRSRYNFDFDLMLPLEGGHFVWERVGPAGAARPRPEPVPRPSSPTPTAPSPAVFGAEPAELRFAADVVRPRVGAPRAPSEIIPRRRSDAGGVPSLEEAPRHAEQAWSPAALHSEAAVQQTAITDFLRSRKRPSAFSPCEGRSAKLSSARERSGAAEARLPAADGAAGTERPSPLA
ncbi:translation initiation factor IF-2-like [Pollicipes pollicipes]|uniref:translation initiation factor IF-2-like n=1 Tax=Pollicipes pollicipes TaxID=41117 RepID=UPI001884F602|nr:translation initiation factor IF-2-like [Pollicipes pollicipes]